MSRALPVLVSCDRLHARLTHAACVARFGAANAPDSLYSGEHGRTYTGCRRCPQGATRAGVALSRPAAPRKVVPEGRAAAVAAVLAGRLTVHDVAESHDVTPGAVRAWIRDARRTARAT